MQSKIRAGIIGAAGYTGGELIRLLVNHPHVKLEFVHSKSNAGNKVSSVHRDLEGETEIIFSNSINEADVIFLCVGHGESRKIVSDTLLENHAKLIDLSQDFRLKQNAVVGERRFVYGLPELNREQIMNADAVANPGCFATSIQLGLLPLVAAGLMTDVYTTGITGSTGAGQSLTETSQFSWRANNIQPYKVLAHQHIDEIRQSIDQSFINTTEYQINFVPWRGDFTRGIFISSQLKCTASLSEVADLYADFYKEAAFTDISSSAIFLKQVVNTNKCLIHLEKVGEILIVHSAIDNLLKGASGQAVQNMNLMFGLDERAGLNLKANYF